MDSTSTVPSGTDSAEAALSSESEPVNGGGNTADDVAPPLAKRAKIDNGTNDSVAVPSGGETNNDEGQVGNEADEIDERSDNGENTEHLDSEELDYEEEEANSEDEALFQQILAMARAGRIPLDYLRAHGIHVELDSDDEDVEYPFEEPPKSIEDVANFIQSEKCQRIMVLAGAGMSVASGIPDFRSSNGLYATLDAEALSATPEQIERIKSDPSFSLDQHLFMENPLPCLEVNREFILGVKERRWKATLAHRFIECLRTKVKDKDGEGKLVRLYTQNIDGLEDQCEGIGHERRIAVHGSMDEAECATCGAKMEFDTFCTKIRYQVKDILGKDPTAPAQSTPIICPSCGAGTVKPSIVLFRSRLPEVFFDNVPNDVKDIDLLLILGTSLAVAPANSLAMRIPKSSMRVLMNREPVGWHLGLDYESKDRDYFAEGNCENSAIDFMEKLGWLNDMKPLLDQGEFPESSAALLRERFQQIEQRKQQPAQEPQQNEPPAPPPAQEQHPAPAEEEEGTPTLEQPPPAQEEPQEPKVSQD